MPSMAPAIAIGGPRRKESGSCYKSKGSPRGSAGNEVRARIAPTREGGWRRCPTERRCFPTKTYRASPKTTLSSRRAGAAAALRGGMAAAEVVGDGAGSGCSERHEPPRRRRAASVPVSGPVAMDGTSWTNARLSDGTSQVVVIGFRSERRASPARCMLVLGASPVHHAAFVRPGRH